MEAGTSTSYLTVAPIRRTAPIVIRRMRLNAFLPNNKEKVQKILIRWNDQSSQSSGTWRRVRMTKIDSIYLLLHMLPRTNQIVVRMIKIDRVCSFDCGREKLFSASNGPHSWCTHELLYGLRREQWKNHVHQRNWSESHDPRKWATDSRRRKKKLLQ